MRVWSFFKKAVSHVGGAIAGLACGWLTTPVGEISRSFSESIHREGSVGGDIIVGNIILLPFYIVLGPLYCAYRGLRYGFSHGWEGGIHESLEPKLAQVRAWQDERERNRLPGNKMRDVYEYYANHSPQTSPRSSPPSSPRSPSTHHQAAAHMSHASGVSSSVRRNSDAAPATVTVAVVAQKPRRPSAPAPYSASSQETLSPRRR